MFDFNWLDRWVELSTAGGITSISLAVLLYGLRQKKLSFKVQFCSFALLTGSVALKLILAMVQPYESTMLGNFAGAVDLAIPLAALAGGIAIWPVMRRSRIAAGGVELEEAREELVHTKQILDAFMRHNLALTCVQDSRGRILYLSQSFWQRLKQNPTKRLLGSTFNDWLPGPIVARIRQAEKVVLHSGTPSENLESYELPGEGMSDWYVIRFPITTALDPEKPLLGTMAIDITAEHEAQKREMQNTAIFRQAVSAVRDYAIFVLDTEGFIKTWNEGAERIKGYAPSEIIGRHFSVFHPEEQRLNGQPQALLTEAQVRGRVEHEDWRLRKDGSRFWAYVVITPFYDADGVLIGFVKVTRDLTSSKALEEQLRIKNEELEAARDKALETCKLKSAFVANISHELRTPLAGILGMNELLLSTKLDEDQQELAQTVHQSSESLLAILNDILDLSKIEAGKVELDYSPMNIRLVVEDCVRLMTPLARAKTLSIHTVVDRQLPDQVVGDSERMKQILLNLVGNAVKFTESGEINVRAELLGDGTPDGHVTARVSVTDTGIGIAAEFKPNLFDPFTQADVSTTRRYGGTGLGLTIAKKLVEQMGGQIGCESQFGRGSTFWFTIPFDKDINERAGHHPAPSKQIATIMTDAAVLVVEDNPFLQDLTVRQLSFLGFRAEVAQTGYEAIEKVAKRHYDIILMDCHLPAMNGFEATARIREMESKNGNRTPIIALTAGATVSDKERCLAAGMEDYLSKPYTIEELKGKITQWIEKSGHADREKGVQVGNSRNTKIEYLTNA